MKFKFLSIIIFLLLIVQNSKAENNLTNIDDIFHIGKMDSHNKNFVLFFKTREKAILAKVRNLIILLIILKICTFMTKRQKSRNH